MTTKGPPRRRREPPPPPSPSPRRTQIIQVCRVRPRTGNSRHSVARERANAGFMGDFPNYTDRHSPARGPGLARPPAAPRSCPAQRPPSSTARQRFVDKAPREVAATLMYEGKRLCSVSTMYRVLRANAEVRERRDQRRRTLKTSLLHFRSRSLNFRPRCTIHVDTFRSSATRRRPTASRTE